MVAGRLARTLLLCLVVLAVGAGEAGAVTLTAACSGTTGDVGSDSGSLVTEIGQANSVGGSNTIELGAGCIYDLTAVNNNWYGPNGLPAISSTLTIDGQGATIARDSTAPKFRLLFVGADPLNALTSGYTSPGAGQLTLRDVTLSDGWAQGGDSDGGGGGAGMGGAIFSQGTVTILNSTLTANKANGGSSLDPAAGPGGGGMGTNSSGDTGGGFGPGTFGGAGGGTGGADAGAGGGGGFRPAENGGPAAITSIGGAGGGPATGTGGEGGTTGGTPGAAGDGSGGGGPSFGPTGSDTGGAFGQGGQGSAAGGGGGVGGGGGSGTESGGGGGFGGGGGLGGDSDPDAGGGMGGFGGGGGAGINLPGDSGFGGGSSTTTVGGGGAGMGGAIFNMQGTVTITASTVAGNTATGGSGVPSDPGKGFGGAVFNMSGSFSAVDSTFADDSADFDGSAIYNIVYDAAVARTAQTTLSGTIVASESGTVPGLTNDKTTYITPSPNLGTANVDVSKFDLVQSIHANTGSSPIVGTPLTTDPLLGPLQDNGGPTETMAPAAGSPAIDAGSALGETTDQRGDPRPVDFPGIANAAGGDGTDIGAFEVQQTCGTQANPSEACHALSVVLAGTGSGSVSGAPGISCPGRCSGSFGASQRLVLTATAHVGSTFAGWSGGCGGRSKCDLAMSADRAIAATFTTAKGPSISRLKQSASAWREGSKLARLSRKLDKPPVGTTFSFNLSEPASITLTFKRSATGRRARGKCVRQTRSNKHTPKCPLTVSAGSLKMNAGKGADKIYFDGLLSRRKKLGLGQYKLTITAVDSAHRRATSRALRFTIVK